MSGQMLRAVEIKPVTTCTDQTWQGGDLQNLATLSVKTFPRIYSRHSATPVAYLQY